MTPSVEPVASLLIVEDDALIASSLARALRAVGHEVDVVGTLAEGVARADHADLVVCDLGLPDGDGLDLIRSITEARPGRPVIALTARAEEGDIVAGLSSGAVDYVTKPFGLAELQARITAQLRAAGAGTGRGRGEGVRSIGDLGIDLRARRVTVGGEEVVLRPREFDLLARLAADVGQVVRREDIMNDVWDENWWGSTKTLDVHVHALRRKLGEEPGQPSRITAIRGVGYRLEDR